MKNQQNDTRIEDIFPPPPIRGSKQLVPITTWADMFRETQITGVEIEEFWSESVGEGAAYFFSWLGEPHITVLVVFDEQGPTNIECRKFSDVHAERNECEPIIAEVMRLLNDAGFLRSKLND